MTADAEGKFPVMLIVQGTQKQVDDGKADYTASHASMRSSLKSAANKRGLIVETRTPKDGTEGIIFQVKPDPDAS
jgi:hypothetical protein